MAVFFSARRAGSEGEAEEDELIGGGDDAGLRGANIFYADRGAVDAEVGDDRRVREKEGHPDDVAGPRPGFRGGGVLAVVVAGILLEDNPGGIAGTGRIRGTSQIETTSN